MNKSNAFYNFLPAFIIGCIEGLIVVLAIFSFLSAKGLTPPLIYIYSSIALLFTAVLLSLGAYYTRKGAVQHINIDSNIFKIYQSLDMDGSLIKTMTEDTLDEKQLWNKTWQQKDNATGGLSTYGYAFAIFLGFVIGGIVLLINNYFFQWPDYVALVIPTLGLGILGYAKYKITSRNPFTGMCLIAISGLAAAIGAYYVGSLF